ncbi:MAG: ATP-binding protein [Erysipelotrichaceae bacterium]|nr:ATP-binding protein [Erysipelotrichaceae bacterium]
MERLLMDKLIQWKEKEHRKPLVLYGARQVGKTWLMMEFGRTQYQSVAYTSFFNNERMKRVFDADYDTDRILMNISAESGVRVIPEETLIILDEIQEAPKALEALKYFCEQAGEYHVIAAGSMPGLSIHEGVSYPVGKVEELTLYPMSFEEYLLALDQRELYTLLKEKKYEWMTDLKEKYLEQLKNYFYVGGMPEAVKCFAQRRDYNEVRTIQETLLRQYRRDFGKHAKEEMRTRIVQVWNSIPVQLAKENKKFFFGDIKKGARMKDFELAIQWLEDYGVVYKVPRVHKPAVPLKGYEDFSAFKLYLLDVGLVSALSGMTTRMLLEEDATFVEFKGALTENYVLQQLKANTSFGIAYYSVDSNYELDFLLQMPEYGIVPVEVKANENLRAKSFKTFCEKNKPELAIRTSRSDYRKESWMVNIPLYAIGTIDQ